MCQYVLTYAYGQADIKTVLLNLKNCKANMRNSYIHLITSIVLLLPINALAYGTGGLQIVNLSEKTGKSIETAKSYFENGDFEKSLSVLDLIENDCINSSIDKVKGDFYYLKAMSLFLIGDPETVEFDEVIRYGECAIKTISNVLDYDTFAELCLAVGMCYEQKGNPLKAESYYRKIVINQDLVPFTSKTITAIKGLYNLYTESCNNIAADECVNLLRVFFKHVIEDKNQIYDESYAETITEFISFFNYVQDKEMSSQAYEHKAKVVSIIYGKESNEYLENMLEYGLVLQFKNKDVDGALRVYNEVQIIGKTINNPIVTKVIGKSLVDWFNQFVLDDDVENAKLVSTKIENLYDELNDDSKAEYLVAKAVLTYQIGLYRDCIEACKNGIQLLENEFTDEYMSLLLLNNFMGRSFYNDGDKKSAYIYLMKAKDLEILVNGNVSEGTIDLLQKCKN